MTFESHYRRLLGNIRRNGHFITRRNGETQEVLNVAASWPAETGILSNSRRAMRMDFAKAEALWILDGRNDIGPLVSVIKGLGDYSDNGQIMAGAYGPRWQSQRRYVLDTLRRDPYSRQAVATIWEPRPSVSADIPCTISWQFMMTDERLDMFVNMRSSDVWLGLPYDAFSWSVILMDTALALGVPHGNVHYHAATLHLYARHYEEARLAISSYNVDGLPAFPAFKTQDELRKWLCGIQ